jgi:hypothetical protein
MTVITGSVNSAPKGLASVDVKPPFVAAGASVWLIVRSFSFTQKQEHACNETYRGIGTMTV